MAAASPPSSKSHAIISPGPNQRYTGNRALGNAVQPGQADTWQSQHLLRGWCFGHRQQSLVNFIEPCVKTAKDCFRYL